jgi:fructuronate reductase
VAAGNAICRIRRIRDGSGASPRDCAAPTTFRAPICNRAEARMSGATLSEKTLGALPLWVARPAYDLAAVSTGIVHFGLGAFHRAHQAVYTDTVLRTDPRWGICGVSLKTPRVTHALAQQDGLYTVLEKGATGTSARVIGAVRETRFLGAGSASVIARISDPAVHVVSLTVTEKGYCHDPATGRLDPAHPDIAHDLAHRRTPVSTIGLLVAGLDARRASGSGPINVVCCDNLPRNGRTVEELVTSFAQAADPDLVDWIGAHVAFPCTMVDRIVPATTDADRAEALHLLGVDDAVAVVAEPFSDWVLENRFTAARPAWEEAGARVAADIAPFEAMKLRLLNGAHSTLAYLGYLLGHEYLWQAASDPLLGKLVERMMALEVAPTLEPPKDVDLSAYCAQLLTRFRNPALPHRTQQIAMDGSQKLPQRLLATVRDRLEGEGSIEHLALAIAGWIRYASGTDEQGRSITVADPLAKRFAAIAAQARGNASQLADGFLGLTTVFGDDLSGNPAFRNAVARDVGALVRDGVRRTLAVFVGQTSR